MEEPNFFIMNNNNNNPFIIDDLLVDFPNHDDDVVLNDAFFDNVIGRNSVDSSNVNPLDSCNSSISSSEAPFSGNFSSGSFSDSQFSGVELCLPYDNVAELEWLSSFKEESFTTVDLQSLHIISTANKTPATDTSSSDTTTEFRSKPALANRINSHIFETNTFVPGKPRSKRPRTAPYDWTSRMLHIKESVSKIKQHKTIIIKRREVVENSVIRCLHCGSDKTPQWRTGPMGPKTLCNACGVRYKSGRLVPEYRPAASPTYVSAKHSNSHRKVMEIRRQKEIRNADRELVYRGSVLGDGCLMDCQSGPGFVEMI